MAIPLRNTIFDKVKEAKSLTDLELYKLLTKDDIIIPEDKFNKLLLDLEILGVIKVSWITKEERRVEAIIVEEKIDKVEEQNKAAMEKDYEASFPGFEK